MNVATPYRIASLRPFPIDLIVSGFFCHLHVLFPFVKVILDGREWLKRLNTSFLLARISRFLVLAVTDWV